MTSNPSFNFGVGGAPAPAAGGGFTFGSQGGAAPAVPSTSGGAPLFAGFGSPPAAAPAPVGAGFGGASSGAAPGFSFGAASGAPSPAPTTFGAGTTTPLAAGTTGAPPAPSTTAPAPLFGGTTTPGVLSFGQTTTAAPPAPATGGGFGGLSTGVTSVGGGKPTAPAQSFGFGTTTTTTATAASVAKPASVPLFGSPAPAQTTPALPSVNFGATAATVPALTPGASFTSGSDSTTADVKTPAPTDGFAFTSPPTKASTAASSTPTPAAPAQTPGGLAPTTTGATPHQPMPAAPATPALQEPTSLDYQTLTVEQILNKYQQELERNALAVIGEAQRVSTYDAMLRDTQRDISQLTLQTTRAMNDQCRVQQVLGSVAISQDEIEHKLDEVDGQVNDLFQMQLHEPPMDADVERERTHHRAAAVETKLQALKETLKAALSELDDMQERMLPGEVGDIVKTLNCHNMTMAELDMAARKLKYDIDQVSALLQS